MNPDKFKKPQFKSYYTPEQAYDEIFNPLDIIPTENENNQFTLNGRNLLLNNNIILEYLPDSVEYRCNSPKVGSWNVFEHNKTYKPHQILLVVKFKGDYTATRQYIMLKYLNAEIPYFRIGTKYFKVVPRETRYKTIVEDVILWSKESIVDDYGKGFLKRIEKFNGFVCRPNNITYEQSYKGYYNMYKKFPHQPVSDYVTLTDIPTISGLMNHIFGEQQEIGYQYFKVLYEDPSQKLPVLCLVSKDRQTGKTTLLNFMQMLFGSNFGIINSETLTRDFNSSYAHLNIIGIDETVIEKASAVEKIKMLATADTLNVNMKNVPEFPVEFFGKIVLATNKETDFMRIDNEEIRFWIRKPAKVNRTDPNLNNKLVAEIPMFLKYLNQIEKPEYLTRMVFTAEQIANKELEEVKRESRSGLHKELELLISDYFVKYTNIHNFDASPTDIKHKWFANDNKISSHYIAKVLKNEMNLEYQSVKRYQPFKQEHEKTGRPYRFNRETFITETEIETQFDSDAKLFYNKDIDDDILPNPF